MHIHVCTTINRPPATVWTNVADLGSHVEWMADARAITFHSEQREGIGTSFTCLTQVGPVRLHDEMTVTDWQVPDAIAIEHRGVVSGRGRFAISPADGATRFCWDEDLTFPAWLLGAIGAAIAKPVLRAIWQRNLKRLKARIEGGGGLS